MSLLKSSKRKTVAIIQARLTSTRLPRKVLLRIKGKTLLQHTIDRVRQATLVDDVIVAAPHKIPFKNATLFIGSEKDVLERYYWCARAYQASIIVRVTADCPMIEPAVIDYAIQYFLIHPFPYITIAPIDGLDIEVFSFEMLELARNEVVTQQDKEHVTPYMKRYTKVSIDTKEEYLKVKKIMESKNGMAEQNNTSGGRNRLFWNSISQ